MSNCRGDSRVAAVVSKAKVPIPDLETLEPCAHGLACMRGFLDGGATELGWRQGEGSFHRRFAPRLLHPGEQRVEFGGERV